MPPDYFKIQVMKRIVWTLLFALSCWQHGSAQNVDWLKGRATLNADVQGGFAYQSNADPKDNLNLKLVLAIFTVKINEQWSFRIMHEFSSNKLLEAYIDYTFSGACRVRLGQFKTAFTIENTLPVGILDLISYYAQSVLYYNGMAGNPLFQGTTGRDMGLMVSGDLWGKKFSYDLAMMQGQGINTGDKNNQKEFVGRLTFRPVSSLAVVGSTQLGTANAFGKSEFNPYVEAGENYQRRQYSLGAEWKLPQVKLRSEYLCGKEEGVKTRGYYLTGCVPLNKKLEAILSYDHMNFNTQLDARQTNYVVGVQYWFWKLCRLQVQYTRCTPTWKDHYDLLQFQAQLAF